jgi:hypothetical protein
LHNDRCPKVRAIYKVVSTRENDAKYERYLSVSLSVTVFLIFVDARGFSNRIEMRGNFASEGKNRGNECNTWHGTTRKCKIGDKGTARFCSDPSCSLCCIMKASFDLKFFGKKTKFGRFGVGIYTSETSSKFALVRQSVEAALTQFIRSDSYSWNDCTSKWKAMLLNKVVVGEGYSLMVNSRSLTKPPTGYDSVSAMILIKSQVIGEVGVTLNYSEIVVYDNDAIRPSYLVMYDVPK